MNDSVPNLFARPPRLIWDLLGAHDIGWANYFVELPEVALWPRNILRYHDHLHDIGDFYDDCKGGLAPPPVTIVTTEIARRLRRGVPGRPDRGGVHRQPFRGRRGFYRSGQNMLFVIVWDEGGGFYDHVPPPAATVPDNIPPDIKVPPDQPGGYDRYGFRVPCLAASPFAKPAHVSSVVYDHTSILATIEHKAEPAWLLTRRDAAASPLTDFIDLSKPPQFPSPAPLPRPTIWPFTGKRAARGATPGTPAGLDAPATPSREHQPTGGVTTCPRRARARRLPSCMARTRAIGIACPSSTRLAGNGCGPGSWLT